VIAPRGVGASRLERLKHDAVDSKQDVTSGADRPVSNSFSHRSGKNYSDLGFPQTTQEVTHEASVLRSRAKQNTHSTARELRTWKMMHMPSAVTWNYVKPSEQANMIALTAYCTIFFSHHQRWWLVLR